MGSAIFRMVQDSVGTLGFRGQAFCVEQGSDCLLWHEIWFQPISPLEFCDVVANVGSKPSLSYEGLEYSSELAPCFPLTSNLYF